MLDIQGGWWAGATDMPIIPAMEQIQWADFEKVEIRVGTVTRVEDFPEARKPAYKLWVDFGEFGIKQSSAQVTVLYRKEELVGRQVIGILNFESKRIAGFKSEVLISGFEQSPGTVVLAQPERLVPNGSKLF
jgi:tRNA-binding protein